MRPPPHPPPHNPQRTFLLGAIGVSAGVSLFWTGVAMLFGVGLYRSTGVAMATYGVTMLVSFALWGSNKASGPDHNHS